MKVWWLKKMTFVLVNFEFVIVFCIYWNHEVNMSNLLICDSDVVGWEWSFFQDQEKHSIEEAYECLLWPTVGGFQLHCFSVWWTSPPSWADSRWGLCFLPLFMNSFSTNFPHIHILGLMKWISFCCSWKWRTRMRLMPCFTIPEVMLSEGCDSPLSLHYK